MIEKMLEIGNLFDFYGRLLSDKQYRVIEYYYIDDLSLSEIGENLGISRQGAHDNLKRAEAKLYSYEETLGLVKKFEDSKVKVRRILDLSEDLEAAANELNMERLKEDIKSIKQISIDIID